VVPIADAVANVLAAIEIALATAAAAATVARAVSIAACLVGLASIKATSTAALECFSMALFQPGLLHCQQEKLLHSSSWL